MAKISTTKTHTSGIALGGIGTGSVELLPDGEFHYWQIANPERLRTVCFDKKTDDGEGSAGALSFWVREASRDKKPIVRKLGMMTETDDFTHRMFAWNKPVEQIDFEGAFPVCDLDYKDRALDCNISLRAVAPFVPHNSDLAATPGFYLDFTVENPTDTDIEVSLLGRIVPDFMNRSEGRKNTLHTDRDGCSVHISPVERSNNPDCGDLCLSLSGDFHKSYITADYTRFLKEYVAHSEFGVTQESFLFGFREKGVLPCSTAGAKPLAIPSELSGLSDIELDSLFDAYKSLPFGASLFERISFIYPDFGASRRDKERFLSCCGRQLERMGDDFGAAALCADLTLKAGERRVISFVLSWYFPNLYAEHGQYLGHYYENLFESSADVNAFLVSSRHSILDPAVAFSELIFRTDMPRVYPEAWSGHLSTIVKSSMYIKNGKFGLWEGLGYCGFHTTDITYHASFPLIALFPDLQKKQMKMGAEFQREDGRVHHCFWTDLNSVDNGFERVDMNMQFVLMVLRDYLFTGDTEYLRSLQKNVNMAMNSIEELDTDRDGLPDFRTKRNTYDSWNFSGTPSYICHLWLAALKAASVIADVLKDTERAEHWSELLEKGKESIELKLWNGEYYDLWCTEKERDGSLMSDQLDGEWFLRMMGIEGNISDQRVAEVIDIIFKNNFDAEAGLINASCPEGKMTSLHTYKNCQAGAVWTGIGYLFAALALSVGRCDIADTVTETIFCNQSRLGYIWDHWECGHHYTRPMSSWSTLIAAAGLSVNAEERVLTLRPIKDNITLPLCLHDLLATVTFADGVCRIECADGSIEGWRVCLPEHIRLVKQ